MESTRPRSQGGFSILEMMVALAIMTIISGVVFQQLNLAMQRSTAEQRKMDLFQEAREFMDQMTRDIRSTGYPNPRNVEGGQFDPTSEPDSQHLAAGLVKIDAGELWFEADVTGNGQVSVIHYFLDTDATKPGCPCLRRSETLKVDGDPVTDQNQPNYQVEVQNVLNGTADNPIFTAYKSDGTKATLPIQMDDVPSSPVADINSIRVTLTVQSKIPDAKTGARPIVSLVSTARLNNCSQAHSSASDALMGCQ